MSKKPKVIEVDPRVVSSLPLLRSGQKLYRSFLQKAPAPSVHDIQLCRFGDYLKHFGFALEKECPGSALDATLKGARRLAPLMPDEEATISTAGWGFPSSLVHEADARSAEVDVSALLMSESPTLIEEVASAVIQPFLRISRIQSPTQSALKKTRCLYMWLATHMKVVLEIPVEEATHAAAPRAIKPKKAPKGNKKSTSREKNPQVAAVVEEVVAINPIMKALTTRIASPAYLAELYAIMLNHVGVSCRVVEGFLKGPSSEEALPWSWNVVTVDDKHYLVDIAFSVYNGPLRKPKVEATKVEGVPPKGKTAKPSAASRKDAAPEDTPRTTVPQGPAPVPPYMSLSTPPHLSVWRRAVEDFYFFTHPGSFIHTHIPMYESDSLLVEPPTRVAWDLAPRQTHNLFQFGVSLSSHRRTQCFTVRSSPFYMTFKNERPADIELCCVLFKGSLWEIPEDLQGVTPLAPEWVWHQRRESDGTETFTVTVPDGGFYTAIIGARHIREDPYGSHISSLSFTPIVEYQMKVNFVPIATPTFPKQHLSPNICRLMSPLARHVLAGPTTFTVMPSCSNVAAVIVVRYAPDATVSFGAVPEDKDCLSGSREILQILRFSADTVTYEGVVQLEPTTMVELWVLYRAPDKNGYTFVEKVAIEEKERAPTPPPPSPPPKAKKQAKRKVSATEVATGEDVEMSQLLSELGAGRLFLPLVSGIQAKTLLTRESGGVVQPQPSVDSEKGFVMRRLAGITTALYETAAALQSHEFRPVGGYFDSRRYA